jgi:hypothetical protein
MTFSCRVCGQTGNYGRNDYGNLYPCDACGGKGLVKDPQLEEICKHLAEITQGLSRLLEMFEPVATVINIQGPSGTIEDPGLIRTHEGVQG